MVLVWVGNVHDQPETSYIPEIPEYVKRTQSQPVKALTNYIWDNLNMKTEKNKTCESCSKSIIFIMMLKKYQPQTTIGWYWETNLPFWI